MASQTLKLLRLTDLPMYNCFIGLTGGIASGKSTARQFLSSMGAKAVDGDVVAHEVYRPGTPVWSSIVNEFGDDIVDSDGTIIRRKLGHKVFDNPAKLRKLEGLVWPAMFPMYIEHFRNLAADHDPSQPLIGVLEAAVLLRAGWHHAVDEVWATVVNEPEQLQRMMHRDGLPEKAARARIAAQHTEAELRAVSRVVVDTVGTKEATREILKMEWAGLMRRLPGASVAGEQ